MLILITNIKPSLSSNLDSLESFLNKDIVELDSSNFEDAVKTVKHALVAFYTDNCDYCEEYMQTFADAASKLKEINPSVTVIKVNVERNEDLKKKYSIEAIPTLKTWEDGEEALDFEGSDISGQGIATWVQLFIDGASQEIASVDEIANIAAAPRTVYAYFKDGYSGSNFKGFRKWAIDENEIQFFRTSDAAVAKELGIEMKNGFGVTLVRNYSGHPSATVQFVGHKAASLEAHSLDEKLEAFLTAEKLPDYIIFRKAREDHGMLVMSVPIRYHMYIVGLYEKLEKETVIAEVRAASAELRGDITIILADHNIDTNPEYNPFVELFRYPKEQKDTFVGIASVVGNERYNCRLEQDIDLTKEFILGCGRAVLAGKAERILASQPVPAEPLDGNITLVVGSTFEKIVKDPTKDVLLEVYAPWCSACQAFEPIYKKLAAAMADVPSVVIAKMDGTENDAKDFLAEEFPMLFFYPAENGAKPYRIDAAGLEDLAIFIHEKAKISFDLPDLDKFKAIDFDAVEDDDEYADNHYGAEHEKAESGAAVGNAASKGSLKEEINVKDEL